MNQYENNPRPDPEDHNVMREENKEAKKTVQRTCIACLATGTLSDSGFKQCSQCKNLYCSQECQTRDWPSHKSVCERPAYAVTSQRKALTYLTSNPTLAQHFKILTILHLNLHRLQPEDHARYKERPFEVDIHLHIEPADIKDFFRLYRPASQSDNMPRKGMPQVFCVSTPRRSTLSPEHLQIWENSRWQPPANEPGSSQAWEPISGFIHYHMKIGGGGGGNQQSWTYGEINSSMIDCVRNETPFTTPIFLGISLLIDMPMNSDSYMEYINAVIRSDDTNDWSLRTKMSKNDKDLYRMASSTMTGPITDFFVQGVREKVVREQIYFLAAINLGFPLGPLLRMPAEDAIARRVHNNRAQVEGRTALVQVPDSYPMVYS